MGGSFSARDSGPVTTLLRRFGAILRHPVPFVLGWRNITLIGGALGILSVLITLLYEPFGTAEYEVPWRTLRLSGYALCYVLPFVLLHGVDRLVYRRQGYRWWFGNELLTRSLLFLGVTTATWLYNIRVVNDLRPRLAYWFDYLVNFSLPNLPIMLPIALLLAYILGTRFPEDPPEPGTTLRIVGEGQNEELVLPLACFLFAEAQQNYVAIHYLRNGKGGEVLFRMTLGQLEDQIPRSIRIHRSYLTHPSSVRSVTGSARRRTVVLEGIDRPLPVSRHLDADALFHGAGSPRHGSEPS